MTGGSFDFSEFRPAAGSSPAGEPMESPTASGGPVGQDAGTWGVREPSAAISVATAPVGLLGVAGGLGLLGVALALVQGTVVWGFLGWFLSGPLALTVLSQFTARDTARRARDVYSAPNWVPVAYWVVVALGVAGLVLGALRIAFWAGRL